ncbi:hypothetical protein Tco_0147407, partial [Tanacetum coccineum]
IREAFPGVFDGFVVGLTEPKDLVSDACSEMEKTLSRSIPGGSIGLNISCASKTLFVGSSERMILFTKLDALGEECSRKALGQRI